MDIETEFSRILQEAIDKEVIIQARVASYTAQGWHLIVSDAPMEDIGGWMQENIQDEWRVFFENWLFKDANDAVLFRLTWS
jgi:hypothetical protein